MKKQIRIAIAICLVLVIISSTSNIMMAHSGRTDANGGHRDNKNASGLGPYHYHCGGNPPHLHSAGICPYSATFQPAPALSELPTPAPSPSSSHISQSTRTASHIEAIPTSSKILIDGIEAKFDAYEINDNNYFKLRDLAYLLNGTAKQFEITWDEDNDTIVITSGRPYTAIGGEMSNKNIDNVTPSTLSLKMLIDGKLTEFNAYSILDNNFIMLRDIAAALNFDVGWDATDSIISIYTAS